LNHWYGAMMQYRSSRRAYPRQAPGVAPTPRRARDPPGEALVSTVPRPERHHEDQRALQQARQEERPVRERGAVPEKRDLSGALLVADPDPVGKDRDELAPLDAGLDREGGVDRGGVKLDHPDRRVPVEGLEDRVIIRACWMNITTFTTTWPRRARREARVAPEMWPRERCRGLPVGAA
jgi:hypothetical protein